MVAGSIYIITMKHQTDQKTGKFTNTIDIEMAVQLYVGGLTIYQVAEQLFKIQDLIIWKQEQ